MSDVVADLTTRLPGRVITDADAPYDDERISFNAIFDGVRPAAIVRARDVEDVRATLALTREDGAPLVIRGGGHSFTGLSTGEGIVLDLGEMHHVEVTSGASRVVVGAGARNVDIALALRGTDRAVPAGACPTVGVVGLTLGGGLGMLMRPYGLTCDSLRRIDLILADGSQVRATEDENADLFWACRGGGGGAFGIVVELEFDPRPVDHPFIEIEMAWGWDHRAAVLREWQEWASTGPRHTSNVLRLTTTAAGGAPEIVADGIFMGSPDGAQAYFDELRRRVGVAPEIRRARATDYLGAEKDEFYPDLTIDQWDRKNRVPMSHLQRWGLGIGSDFVMTPWTDEAADVIGEWVGRRQADPLLTHADPGSNLGKVWFETMGGAIADVAPTDTAFAHRAALFGVQFQSRWDAGAPMDVQEANLEWLGGFYDAMGPWRSGAAYINYTDADAAIGGQEYFGQNLDRLRAVADRYDPGRVFAAPWR